MTTERLSQKRQDALAAWISMMSARELWLLDLALSLSDEEMAYARMGVGYELEDRTPPILIPAEPAAPGYKIPANKGDR